MLIRTELIEADTVDRIKRLYSMQKGKIRG